MEYGIPALEGLATYIDDLLERKGEQTYWENKRRNEPKVLREIQGLYGEDLPSVSLESGDEELDALFQHIIDPKRITGTIRRGGGEYECNLVWSDICRNGLGPNQFERISKECRRLILEELEKENQNGEKALSYLESHAMDMNLRWRTRRDWVDFLESYAYCERLIRSKEYREEINELERELGSEEIDAEALKAELPGSVPDKLFQIAERIYRHELALAETSGDFSDYYIRLDLLRIFEHIGTEAALERVRERRDDEREAEYVREEAARILKAS